MERQETQKRQSNPKEKEQSLRHYPSRCQTTLQSYNYQNCRKQKQTYRSMEQDRQPRNKPIHLWAS